MRFTLHINTFKKKYEKFIPHFNNLSLQAFLFFYSLLYSFYFQQDTVDRKEEKSYTLSLIWICRYML